MRRLRPINFIGVAVLALLAVTATGTAIAYFTAGGTGECEAKTIAELAKPAIATATPAVGGTVTLSWTSVSAPGPGNVTYKVERNGGGANGTCTSMLSVTSCVDSGLQATPRTMWLRQGGAPGRSPARARRQPSPSARSTISPSPPPR